MAWLRLSLAEAETENPHPVQTLPGDIKTFFFCLGGILHTIGGVPPQPPLPSEQTHASENITFAHPFGWRR